MMLVTGSCNVVKSDQSSEILYVVTQYAMQMYCTLWGKNNAILRLFCLIFAQIRYRCKLMYVNCDFSINNIDGNNFVVDEMITQ